MGSPFHSKYHVNVVSTTVDFAVLSSYIYIVPIALLIDIYAINTPCISRPPAFPERSKPSQTQFFKSIQIFKQMFIFGCSSSYLQNHLSNKSFSYTLWRHINKYRLQNSLNSSRDNDTDAYVWVMQRCAVCI